MTESPCTCGHDGKKHAWTEPTVCGELNCKCVKFDLIIDNKIVFSDIEKYKEQFKTIHDKMRWVLTNWKFFRNYTNKDVVLAWWKFVNNYNPQNMYLSPELYKKLDQPESITRARRKLVESNPELYGPFIPSIQEQKLIKQYAIQEYVTEH